jgi:hypothetical protein
VLREEVERADLTGFVVGRDVDDRDALGAAPKALASPGPMSALVKS